MLEEAAEAGYAATGRIKDPREFMLEDVSLEKPSLSFAAAEHKTNRWVTFEAVPQEKHSLGFAAAEHKTTR